MAPVEISRDWEARDCYWFQQGLSYGPLTPTVGILLTSTGSGYKAYVGIALGLDLVTDVHLIARHGGRLPIDVAARFWPSITDWAS